MRIEWLPEAVGNLETQLAYIAERNPRAAIDMGDGIEAAVARLADHPESARPGRVPGTRELVVTGTPYVVVYRIEPAAVAILRVLHGAQDWPPGEAHTNTVESYFAVLKRGITGTYHHVSPQHLKRYLAGIRLPL